MNSIINKNSGEINSMDSLVFTWIALFSDGTKIEQYENGIEHRFREVQDRVSELVYFNLTNRRGQLFTVDVVNGAIGFNDLVMCYREIKEKKNNVRLIFFRRHTVNLTNKTDTIIYHLGFQYLDKLGNNQKIILQIDSEGNWFLGDN